MNRPPIPYGKQFISEEDIEAVVEALRSESLTQGPKIAEFENIFAEYVGSRYAVAVSNGTAALHLSCLSLNILPGDRVITTAITFAASANCVRYCGGEVVFADIDPHTYLIDINSVKKILLDKPKGYYKGLILVDFAGRAVDLESFRILADEYGLWIIEDACHSPGGYFIDSEGNRQLCGNCNYADLAIFSFHPVKHIACGEGGMITTNNEELYSRLLKLRTHGITRDSSKFQNSLEFALGTADFDVVDFPGWYMEMQELGYNYRLTDFQAALGISQLKKAAIGLLKRKEIALIYSKAFENKSFIKGQSSFIDGHAYHLYVLEVNERHALYNHLRTKNIFCQIHYIPTHLMPYYRELGGKEGDLPAAENYYKHCISLPMYPSLGADEQRYVINEVLNFYSE